MIELKEVSLEYQNGILALKDINLHIGQGELVYIAGPSGSGKTSLLKLLMGMENPTAGTVTVLGKSLTNAKPRKISRIRRKIGPVFQDLKLIPGRTALENVLMGVRFLNFSWAKKNENALIAIERVGLAHKAYSMVENLSLGELQRVALARAIAREPKIIIADEPTANLDHDNAVNIFNILSSLKNQNITVIVATHATHLFDPKENFTLIRMDQGSISIEKRFCSNGERDIDTQMHQGSIRVERRGDV